MLQRFGKLTASLFQNVADLSKINFLGNEYVTNCGLLGYEILHTHSDKITNNLPYFINVFLDIYIAKNLTRLQKL
jgi:hypothetical protein